MAGPYRPTDEPPLARYPLCGSWLPHVFAASGGSLLVLWGVTFALVRMPLSFPVVALAIVALFLLAMGVFGMAEMRIGGRRGELRLYRDRIELPRPRGREPIVVRLSSLRLHVTHQVVRFMLFGLVPAGEMNRGILLSFVFPGGSRVLSDRVFQSREAAMQLVEDVTRLQAGEDPRAPDARPPQPREATTDELDARIDRELREL